MTPHRMFGSGRLLLCMKLETLRLSLFRRLGEKRRRHERVNNSVGADQGGFARLTPGLGPDACLSGFNRLPSTSILSGRDAFLTRRYEHVVACF
jgi:hypothetical protein